MSATGYAILLNISDIEEKSSKVILLPLAPASIGAEEISTTYDCLDRNWQDIDRIFVAIKRRIEQDFGTHTELSTPITYDSE